MDNEVSGQIEQKFSPGTDISAIASGSQTASGIAESTRELFESKAQVTSSTPLKAHKTRVALIKGLASPLRSQLEHVRQRKLKTKMARESDNTDIGHWETLASLHLYYSNWGVASTCIFFVLFYL